MSPEIKELRRLHRMERYDRWQRQIRGQVPIFGLAVLIMAAIIYYLTRQHG